MYSSKTKSELIAIYKEKQIKGYSTKTKQELIDGLVASEASNHQNVDNNSITETRQDLPSNTTVDTLDIVTPLSFATVGKSQSDLPSNTTVGGTIVPPLSPATVGKSQSDLPLKMIDLFAGTGAFTYAFQSTDLVECVFANDMVEWSKTIYDHNFGNSHSLTLGDLNDIDVTQIPQHDILTGGFPCQPFSIAGKRDGFNDVRSNVFWKILEIIDYHQPKCVVLENVKNLVSHDSGKTFETIRSNLENRGYNIHYKVLNTSSITGVPQHRERIYIVCIRSKKISDKFSLEFNKIQKQTIESLLETNVPSKYYYTERSSTWELVNNAVKKHNTVYQYRRVYVRENKSNECPTLTANMGTGGHNVPIILDNNGIRKFTPRECFRFQGFPDDYRLPERMSDSNLYKLAGNAVSVPVVKLIAERLVPLLLSEHD